MILVAEENLCKICKQNLVDIPTKRVCNDCNFAYEPYSAWSCLVDSFSIVTNIPTTRFLETIGHDGSEIIEPTLPEPFCRRSFHITEVITFLWEQNIKVVQFDCIPRIQVHFSSNIYTLNTVNGKTHDERLSQLLSTTKGVMKSHNHACANIEGKIYDPSGYIRKEFPFYTYYVVTH